MIYWQAVTVLYKLQLRVFLFDFQTFEGLVKLVDEAVKLEYALCPNKPIYLVGDSFGGCLALAVAARNPTVDLVLILANPGVYQFCIPFFLSNLLIYDNSQSSTDLDGNVLSIFN